MSILIFSLLEKDTPFFFFFLSLNENFYVKGFRELGFPA